MELLQAILNNITYIGVVIALIFLFQLGNLCFGISLNVIMLHQEFEKDKIKRWALKTVFTLVGTVILCAGISLVPYIITFIGIEIPEDYSIIINFSLVLLSAFGTLKKEAEKCFENYKKCIEIL